MALENVACRLVSSFYSHVRICGIHTVSKGSEEQPVVVFLILLRTSSRSNDMKNMVVARFQRLVLKNFRRSWYISTEDLLPTKEASWPERIHLRLIAGSQEKWS
jgi:hypothetical protein